MQLKVAIEDLILKENLLIFSNQYKEKPKDKRYKDKHL